MSTPIKNETGSPARRLQRDERTPDRSRYYPAHRPSVVASPSSQILQELNRLLISEDQTLQRRLNDQVDQQEKWHIFALAESAAEHDRVRRNAERARELLELELEKERRRREDEETRALESERKAQMERESQNRRREKERLEREEEERKRRDTEERELRQTQVRLDEQREKDEADAAKLKTEQEERTRIAKERAATAMKRVQAEQAQQSRQAQEAQQASQTAPTTATPAVQKSVDSAAPAPVPAAASATKVTPTTQIASQAPEHEAIHKRYLQAHKSLKQMRQLVISHSKNVPALKTKLGDWRREIKKCMGQLTVDKAMNRKPMVEIQRILREALKFNEPSVDMAPYLVSQGTDGTPLRTSGVFVYLLNIFAKSVVAQFISEASAASSAKVADPIGVAAVTIFATPDLKLNNSIPLIDLLLAKYHVCCPVLFGIHGNQKTASGRERLGWWKEEGAWVTEQRHIERMTGLAAGFAALTLRDFSKSRNANPMPNTYYWKAMSCIVNTPPQQVQPTHFVVLKALIDGSVPRFIGFYGAAAHAALRFALVEFPAGAPQSVAASQVQLLPEVLKRDLKITL